MPHMQDLQLVATGAQRYSQQPSNRPGSKESEDGEAGTRASGLVIMAAQVHFRAARGVHWIGLVVFLITVCLIMLDGQAVDAQESAYLIHAHLHIIPPELASAMQNPSWLLFMQPWRHKRISLGCSNGQQREQASRNDSCCSHRMATVLAASLQGQIMQITCDRSMKMQGHMSHV